MAMRVQPCTCKGDDIETVVPAEGGAVARFVACDRCALRDPSTEGVITLEHGAASRVDWVIDPPTGRRAMADAMPDIEFEPVALAMEAGPEGRELPGMDSLGCGYNVFSGKYADPFSITQPLFDFPVIQPFQTDEKHTYLKPDLVHYRALRLGDIKIFHGSSLQDYQRKLSASLEIEGGIGMFSGSVETEFDETSRSTTTMEFTTAMDLYSRALLTLPDERELTPILRPAVRDDLAGGDPQSLLERYGTHYLAKVVIGARAALSSSTNTTRFSSSLSVAAAAEMHYKGLVGSLDASAKAKYQSDLESFSKASKIQVRVRGGIEAHGRNIAQGTYDQWLDSVDDRPVFIDFAPDSLRPLWDLCEDPARRSVLRDAYDEFARSRPTLEEPSIVPIYQFHQVLQGCWYPHYSANPDSEPTWVRDHVSFYAHCKPVEGSAPVYQYVAQKPRRYHYSPNPNVGQGWTRQEVAFHAYPAGAPDRVAIYQHHASVPAWRFLYSTTRGVGHGWTVDSVPFYGCRVD
jgi:hypothetical protein